nr:alkaline phosphatase PhoX [Vibrio crassostreae]
MCCGFQSAPVNPDTSLSGTLCVQTDKDPNGCEVTGFTISPDFKSLFVNIQHPANWPSSDDATVQTQGNVRPRASTVVIRREDGGEIAV